MAIYRGGTKVELGQLKIGGRDVKEVYWGATKIWPDLLPALIPTYGEWAGIVNGWRVPIANFYYNQQWDWSATTTAGYVTINGGGLVEVLGLAHGQSSTVTVTTSRTGYANGSSSTSGKANDYEPPPPVELNFDNPSGGGYTGGGTFISYSATGTGQGNASECSGTAVIGWDVRHYAGQGTSPDNLIVELVETKTVPCTFKDNPYTGGANIYIEGSPSTNLDTCYLEGSGPGGRALRQRIVEATVKNPNGSISKFSSLTNWITGPLSDCP